MNDGSPFIVQAIVGGSYLIVVGEAEIRTTTFGHRDLRGEFCREVISIVRAFLGWYGLASCLCLCVV